MPPRKTAPTAAALAKFEQGWSKKFGSGSVVRSRAGSDYTFVSSGSLELDIAMGGGYPLGRMSEFYGPDNLGKTTMALIAMANAQRQFPKRLTAYVDVERKLDRSWAAAHGVDLSRMLHIMPEDAEDTADMVREAWHEMTPSFTVFDSVGGLITRSEREKTAAEATVAGAAKIVTRLVRDAPAELVETQGHLAFINQQRARIGSGPGPDTTRPGGYGLAYMCTHRGKFRTTTAKPLLLGAGDDAVTVGYTFAVKLEKNQITGGARTARVTMITIASEKYGPVGIQATAENAYTYGVQAGVIERDGAIYRLPGGLELRKKADVIVALDNDRALADTVRAGVLEALVTGKAPVEVQEDPEDLTEDTDDAAPAAVAPVELEELNF